MPISTSVCAQRSNPSAQLKPRWWSLRDDAAPAAERDHRGLEALRQLEHLGAGAERAAADHDHRIARAGQRARRRARARPRPAAAGGRGLERRDERDRRARSNTSHGISSATGRGRPLARGEGAPRRAPARLRRLLDPRGPLGQRPQRRELVGQLVQVPHARRR